MIFASARVANANLAVSASAFVTIDIAGPQSVCKCIRQDPDGR